MGKRTKTKYPGVYYIEGVSSDGKPEKIYYIKYRRGGKTTEEPVGRQFRDDMTPAKAAQIRTRRIEGGELSNKEQRSASVKSSLSLDKIFSEYQSHSHHKQSTLDRESDRYSRRIKPKFGNRQPHEIRQADFDAVIKELKDEGKAPQTIKHVAGLLFRLLKFASERGYCDAPAFRINTPRINNQKTETLTDEQLRALMNAMQTDPHPYAGKLMMMALFTGMRAGELFKLEWRDVDFEKGFILIREPKAGHDKTIPLNEAAKDLLEAVPKIKNSPFVFPAQDGSQRTTIKKQATRIRKAAGLPDDFRPIHGLRHVFASTLASSGQVELYTIQKLLTHSDPKTTQRYAHLRDEALKKAADLAGKIFNDK